MKNFKKRLKEKIKNFPDLPGVYLMKTSRKKILYIGKGKSIKKKVAAEKTTGESNRRK